MKVGTISTPIPYRTDDGRSAVRILYYKAKHPPHFANLKDDYQKLETSLFLVKRTMPLKIGF